MGEKNNHIARDILFGLWTIGFLFTLGCLSPELTEYYETDPGLLEGSGALVLMYIFWPILLGVSLI
jgi:hypothetical protein